MTTNEENILLSSNTTDDEDEDDEEEDLFEQPPFDVEQISDFVHDHGFSPTTVEYEGIITTCGYGWFQRFLLLVCGWAFLSDSIEIQVCFSTQKNVSVVSQKNSLIFLTC